MAQVVDTKGKTKAAPSGKIMNNSQGGAFALNSALGNELVKGSDNTATNTLSEVLSRGFKPKVSSSGGSRKRTSYNGLSGGTPSLTRGGSSLGWSPTYSSLSKPHGIIPKKNNPAPMPTDQDGIITASGLQQDVKPIELAPDYGTDESTNQAYIDYFVDNNVLTEDQAQAVMNRPHSWEWMQDYNDDGEANFYKDYADLFAKPKDAVLDDGRTSNYHQLTADQMTGTAYRHYRDDLGMGGRDDIDLTRTYSKADEAKEYGFKPFVPDSETLTTMVATDLLGIPFDIGRNLSNARMQYLTPDFQIEYDDNGERRSVSGKEFEKKAPAYMNEFYHDQKYNQGRYLSEPEDGSAYSALINQIEIPDVDGNTTYHYGHLVDVHDLPDGTFQFAFSDGSTVKTNKDYLDSVYDEETGSIDLGDVQRVPLQDAAMIVDLDNIGDDKHRGMINEVMIPDEFGNETYHYYMDSANDDNTPPFSVDLGPNGTYTFTFQDGTTVNAPQEYFDQVYDREQGMITLPFNRVWVDDIKNDMDVTYDKPAERDLHSSDIVYYPDLVLSDGTRMTLDDVERLWLDKTPGNDEDMIDPNTGEVVASDDDINYRFGTMGDKIREAESKIPVVGGVVSKVPTPAKFLADFVNNRPSRLGGQEIFSEGSAPDTSNIINDTVDWSLGSLPISMGKILPWMYSASGAIKSFTGSDPNSYDPVTNSYGLSVGEWDDNGDLRYGAFSRDEDGNLVRDDDYSNEVMYSNATGNLAVPFTEMLVGPVGEQIIPLDKLSSKIQLKSALGNLAKDELFGAGGEAFEEILGNPFEEFTSYGPSGMYSAPVVDEAGEPIHDMYGHELRMRNEPTWLRAANALNDTTNNMNAAAGGALVDLGMSTFMPTGFNYGVVPSWNESLAPRIYNAVMQDRARHLTGTDLYVSPEQVDPAARQDFDAGYANLINDKAAAYMMNGE